MSRQTYRANLSASEFPLLMDLRGRTISVPTQGDTHYIRPNGFSGLEADKDIGIPQIIFCENVVPFSAGFQSVDYTVPIQPIAANDFDQMFYLRDVNENRTMFVPAGGKCYIYNTSTNLWVSVPKTVPAGSICSVANVKQRTFVHFSGNANFYEWTLGALSNVTLAGLTPANIRGLTSANSYLVAWDYDTVYWSSTITPTDFVPSLATGAGSQKVLALKGRIVYCKQTEEGFVIYTTTSAIYARYSGNIRFPWVFAEIKGASGIGFPDDACDDSDGTSIYVNTNDGLMSFDRIKANDVFPTVSEFLACGMLEQYNYSTKTVDVVTYVGRPKTKISFIASRWLVISYGTTAIMSHALIYDTSLKRWGKLRINHVDCFEYFGDTSNSSGDAVAWVNLVGAWQQQPKAWAAYGTVQSGGVASSTTPYKSIGFLGADGKISVVDFQFTTTSDVGILYLGRFQFVRARLATLIDVEAEGQDDGINSKLAILTSYDGKNVDKTTYPLKTKAKNGLSKWQMRLTGVNHVLRFEGNFQLNTVQLRTLLNGER